MPQQTRAPMQDDLLDRLCSVLMHARIDWTCRETLRETVQRFALLERLRERRRLLHEARDQAARIASLLNLIADVGEIDAADPDVGVFTDIACLFEDVATSAALGAADMRALAVARKARPGREERTTA